MQRKTFRALQLVVVYAACLTQGITGALYGASLLDLSEVFGTSIAATSALGTTWAATSVAGAILSGPLFTAFDAHILMCLCGVVKGFSLTLVPSSGSLLVAHIFIAIFGLTVSFNEAGSYNIFVGMQNSVGSSISTIVQGYHVMYAFGSFLAPFVVRPFISKRQISHNSTDQIDVSNHTGPVVHHHSESRVWVAYAIIGAVALTIGCCFCILKRLEPLDDPEQADRADTSRNVSIPQVSSRRSWILTVLTATHAFLYIHIFICVADYLAVYAVSQNIAKDDSLFYISAFYGAFGGFRVVPVILSTKISATGMVILADTCLLLSTSCLYLFGHLGPSYLWYCTFAVGATLAPIYGSGNAWLLSKEKLSRIQTAALFAVASSGAVFPPLIIGRWIEEKPEVFPFVPFVSTGVLVLVMISMIRCSGSFVEDPKSETVATNANSTKTSQQSLELKQDIAQAERSVSNSVPDCVSSDAVPTARL